MKPDVLMTPQARDGAITDVVCPGKPGLGMYWAGKESVVMMIMRMQEAGRRDSDRGKKTENRNS